MLIFALIIPPAGAEQRLLVVTDEWAPYVYQENGIIRGFDYEVMVRVFEAMGYRVDVTILPWKRCLRMIESKRADAILDISLNEKRKTLMYFPEENISHSVSVLFHLQGKKFTYENLEDLRGLTIGTILGYKYNKEFLAADYFRKEPVKSEKQNLEKLINGRIDLFLSNKYVGLFSAKKMGVLDKIDYIRKPVSSGDNYVAFSRKRHYEDLAHQFSQELKRFKTKPEYPAIFDKYNMQLPFADQ